MTNVIDVEALADMPKLLTVSSVVNVDGYQNVPVAWFVNRDFDDYKTMWLGLPWTAFIAADHGATGYGYTKSAVAELFTEGEAKMLVEYLKRIAPDDVPTVTPFKLPVRGLMTPLAEKDCGAFLLFEREDYSLPFRVGGYFCVTQGLFVRKEKSGRFVVYKDGMPISTPFADCNAASAWKDHLLPEQGQQLSELDLET
jgi:hypothetical protein